MLTNAQIKYINSLQTKKHRQKYQQFIAEGEKIVAELLNSHFKIETIYALKEWVEENSGHQARGMKILEITEQELKKISLLSSPNKVLAVVEIPPHIKESKLKEKLSLALDNIQDPGNLGTIIRIADWFGIENVFCSPGCADAFNPKVVQATMGAIARVKVAETDLTDLFNQYKDMPVYGAMLDGENIFQLQTSPNAFILIGNESKGISEKLLPFITKKITVPKTGEGESLNAAVATGIICAVFRK